jgi:hypothetical protein
MRQDKASELYAVRKKIYMIISLVLVEIDHSRHKPFLLLTKHILSLKDSQSAIYHYRINGRSDTHGSQVIVQCNLQNISQGFTDNTHQLVY